MSHSFSFILLEILIRESQMNCILLLLLKMVKILAAGIAAAFNVLKHKDI
jgi:hypothetical protein